jgi:hypothetical protein
MKSIQQAQKGMFFKYTTQEYIPHFLLPTKRTQIFEETLKMAVA